MGRRSKAGAAWWAKLAPEKRAEIKRRQVAGEHHHREDAACVACGTDATAGCVARFRRHG